MAIFRDRQTPPASRLSAVHLHLASTQESRTPAAGGETDERATRPAHHGRARIRGYYERASIPKINRSQLFETEIPLPPLATQQEIVGEIEAEQKLVTANRELIERFEKKIQATLARVWGEEESAASEV